LNCGGGKIEAIEGVEAVREHCSRGEGGWHVGWWEMLALASNTRYSTDKWKRPGGRAQGSRMTDGSCRLLFHQSPTEHVTREHDIAATTQIGSGLY